MQSYIGIHARSMPAYIIHISMHTYMYTNKQMYIRDTYIYICIYVHTSRHTDVHAFVGIDVQTSMLT